MSIGSRIKEARKNVGITQEELAASIGVTKGAIANYENEVSIPKIELFLKLMEILQVDANYLYQDDILAKKKQPILNEDRPSVLDDKELVQRLLLLPPEDSVRVRDFVQGLLEARKGPSSHNQ